MTDKRFETNMRLVIDTEKKYGARVLNAEEVVDLLNEVHEENKELKQELDNIYLLIGNGDWSGLVDLLIDDEKCKTIGDLE